jgi:hypothetical protein
MASKRRRRDRTREPVHVTRFDETMFDEWPLQNGDAMRVSIAYFKGHDFVHVRRWRRGTNGRLYATEKGVAIGIDKLPGLLRALKSVRAHAREIGLLPPASRFR